MSLTQYATFEEGLIASGCYFQPECGCYVREEGDYTYSYLQDPDSVGDNNTWNYEKYYYNKKTGCDEFVESKRFTV
jgi:hypothetical protein